MDFNISAQFNNLLEEPFWILSSEPPSAALVERLELAYVEIRSMFISENPFFLTVSPGRQPQVGQLVPGVFFCCPDRFQFGDYTLINSAFWDQCLSKHSFIDALVAVGKLTNSENRGQELKQWEQSLGFHCFKIFPD